nr:hypothetical protein [Bacillus swezeyi]
MAKQAEVNPAGLRED